MINIIVHRTGKLHQIDIARAHDTACVLIIDQCKKQMLKRCILVMMLVGNCQRLMQGALQTR